jgi:hypothetical protein
MLHGQASVGGRWVDRVVGLEGVRADIAMLQTPDGNGRLELTLSSSASWSATRTATGSATSAARESSSS